MPPRTSAEDARELDALVAQLDAAGRYATCHLLKENPLERTELVEDAAGRRRIRKTLHVDESSDGDACAHGTEGESGAAPPNGSPGSMPNTEDDERRNGRGDRLPHPYLRLVHRDIPCMPRIQSAIRIADELVVTIEYIDGTDLRKIVEERGPLGLSDTVNIARDVGKALDALHHMEGGAIVHRDVNPGNIIVAGNGRARKEARPDAAAGGGLAEGGRADAGAAPGGRADAGATPGGDAAPSAYLIDLGIARSWNRDGVADTHIWGTSGYAAPEQFGFRQTDARADQYALAATCAFMMTGLEGADLRSSGALERLPDDLAAVLSRALSLDPAARFDSVAEFLRGLETCMRVGEDAACASPPNASALSESSAPKIASVPAPASPAAPATAEGTAGARTAGGRTTNEHPAGEPPADECAAGARPAGENPLASALPPLPASLPPALSAALSLLPVPQTWRAPIYAGARISWRIWQTAIIALAVLLVLFFIGSVFAPDVFRIESSGDWSQAKNLCVAVFWVAGPAIILANPGNILGKIPALRRRRPAKLGLVLAAFLIVPPLVFSIVEAVA